MNYYPYLPFNPNPFAGGFQSHLGMTTNSPYNDQDDTNMRPWSDWEDKRLKMASEKFSGKGWRKISMTAFPDGSRTKEECLKRWRQITKSVSVKGLWTTEEDSKLTSLVAELGAEKWVAIAARLETRTGKQCRERWHNHLDPRINKAPFTTEEEELIFSLHEQIGSKWAEMSKHLPGRSDNSIKNFYNTAMQRKRKLQMTNESDSNHQQETKRMKEFAWPSPYQSINPIHMMNMRVLTPPDTPQPCLDMYGQPWSFPTKPFLNKMDLFNPNSDSSPTLPQGSFERAVFDQPKLLSSQTTATPNPTQPDFHQSYLDPTQFPTTNTDYSEINHHSTSNQLFSPDPQHQHHQQADQSNPGYLGLVGVNYPNLNESEVQDYLFMNNQ